MRWILAAAVLCVGCGASPLKWSGLTVADDGDAGAIVSFASAGESAFAIGIVGERARLANLSAWGEAEARWRPTMSGGLDVSLDGSDGVIWLGAGIALQCGKVSILVDVAGCERFASATDRSGLLQWRTGVGLTM